MPTYDTRCEVCGNQEEISKPRHSPLPVCTQCGGSVKQVYHPTAISYQASGFFATDNRMEKLVGTKRARRFEAQKAEAIQRQHAGRLTPYEQSLESV